MVNLSLKKALFEIKKYADIEISVRTHFEHQWTLLSKTLNVLNVFPILLQLHFARHAT